MGISEDLQGMQFAPYNEIFGRFRTLASEYGGLSMDSVIQAWTRTMGKNYQSIDPYVQNRRVKAVSTLPRNMTKDKVAEMLTAPNGNEQGLRQVGHALEWTAYPLFHARKVFTDTMTYHNYVMPQYVSEAEAKRPDFMREWQLVDKLRKAIDPKATAHEIAGQAVQEGKVFYYPRISVDKVHNKVNYAFMQQLPSDYVKIVGFNNISKYTLAFNMMYFSTPGADPLQYGDLFRPYLDDFQEVTTAPKRRQRGRMTPIFASDDGPKLNMTAFRRLMGKRGGRLAGMPQVYVQGGNSFYWVTLPVDKVFTFEIDDATRTVASPLAGLYLALVQIAQYEQIQLELVQNPLVSLFTGEIPYNPKADKTTTQDDYRLSNSGRAAFEALWYQMLMDANTSGIGWFTAPVENIKMHQLAEAPSATKISAAGYSYAMAKAGLSGIVPTTEDPKSGLANISLQIESKFAECIYTGYKRMMTAVLDGLGLKYSWAFDMFGTIATDKDRMEAARQGMTLGILPQTLIYMAMNGMSVLDDLSVSNAIIGAGLLEKRIPLTTSYNTKDGGGNSQGGGAQQTQAAHDQSPGGRPSSEGQVTSEGQEKDLDTYGE